MSQFGISSDDSDDHIDYEGADEDETDFYG